MAEREYVIYVSGMVAQRRHSSRPRRYGYAVTRLVSWVIGEREEGEGSTCYVGFHGKASPRSKTPQPIHLEFTSPDAMRCLSALLMEQASALEIARDNDPFPS